MALLDIVGMSDEERAARRELDESCYRRVKAAMGKGLTRPQALTRASVQLGIQRQDVIAGYWRHVRREGIGA